MSCRSRKIIKMVNAGILPEIPTIEENKKRESAWEKHCRECPLSKDSSFGWQPNRSNCKKSCIKSKVIKPKTDMDILLEIFTKRNIPVDSYIYSEKEFSRSAGRINHINLENGSDITFHFDKNYNLEDID